MTDIDPQAISNGGGKIKLGVVDQVRKTEKGVEAHFALDNDGADAVADGWKFPSGFWYVKPLDNATVPGGTIRCQPFRLISVALTQFPNISGVESLANSGAHASATKPNQSFLMKHQILGLCIARNLTIPANPTEGQIIETLARALPNGDGDMDDKGDDATKAGKKAFRLSGKAGDKQGHKDASAAHLSAATEHETAGNEDAAGMHTEMAKYHANCAK